MNIVVTDVIFQSNYQVFFFFFRRKPYVHFVNICRRKLSQLAKHELLQAGANLAGGGKLSQLGAEDRMS